MTDHLHLYQPGPLSWYRGWLMTALHILGAGSGVFFADVPISFENHEPPYPKGAYHSLLGDKEVEDQCQNRQPSAEVQK
jgi:hypothetical protein